MKHRQQDCNVRMKPEVFLKLCQNLQLEYLIIVKLTNIKYVIFQRWLNRCSVMFHQVMMQRFKVSTTWILRFPLLLSVIRKGYFLAVLHQVMLFTISYYSCHGLPLLLMFVDDSCSGPSLDIGGWWLSPWLCPRSNRR